MSWEGYQLITFSWVLFAVTTLFVAGRLYVQLRYRYRPWREIYVFAAWIMYLGTAIIFSLMNHWGQYNHYEMSDSAFNSLLKANYSQAFLWMTSLYCCKAALLCFYEDLTPTEYFPKTAWGIIVGWVLVVIGAVFQIGRLLFDCWPFRLNWDVEASCGSNAALIMTSLSLHLVTNVIVYTLPFFLLHNLSTLSWKTKAGAALLFTAGLFNVVSAILQTAYYSTIFRDRGGLYAVPDWIAAFGAAHAWLYTTQQGTSIIIICAPQLRRLWKGTSPESMRNGSDRPGDEEAMKKVESDVSARAVGERRKSSVMTASRGTSTS